MQKHLIVNFQSLNQADLLVQKLAHYLEAIADGNEAVLLSTGYDLSHVPVHRATKTEAGGTGQA